MTNIFIKIFKNIFLLIMSILKTLSSNYIPLLLLSLAISNLTLKLQIQILTRKLFKEIKVSFWTPFFLLLNKHLVRLY